MLADLQQRLRSRDSWPSDVREAPSWFPFVRCPDLSRQRVLDLRRRASPALRRARALPSNKLHGRHPSGVHPAVLELAARRAGKKEVEPFVGSVVAERASQRNDATKKYLAGCL